MTPSQAFQIIDQATQPNFVPSRQHYVQIEEALTVIAKRLALADELEKPIQATTPGIHDVNGVRAVVTRDEPMQVGD